MPFCPFCRKSIEPNAIWCDCGLNLSRYENLPVTTKEIKPWLLKNEPNKLGSPSLSGKSLIVAAKEQLISTQETQISDNSKHRAEILEAENLFKSFLADCQKENLDPTINIGQLRKERWRQWKRIPTEYREHAPQKDFRLAPGYLFEMSIGTWKDEVCLSVDGSLYKHQLNAPDPYPLEEILNTISLRVLADALTTTLVWLLKNKQKPAADSKKGKESVGKEPLKKSRGFKLPNRKRKPEDQVAKETQVDKEPSRSAEKDPATVNVLRPPTK